MEQQNSNLFDLQIDQQGMSYLSESAKWARFLAILGFILCGLMVLLALFFGTIMTAMTSSFRGVNGMSAMGSGFITFFYLIIAVIWLVPCLYLYRFGSRLQDAIRNNQQDVLNTSFKNLKSYFKFIGILCIVGLAFYALAIVAAVVFGVSAMR